MRRAFLILSLPLALAFAGEALARKTNEPVYEDPFDLAAGGASLTRATKEGLLFSNPAQLPQSGQTFRWLGATVTLLANKESISTAREMLANSKSGKSDGGDDSAQQEQADAFADKVFKNPVRVGWGAALSLLMSNFGLSVFSRFEPDVQAQKFGATGLPQLEFQAESYHGVAAGTAIRTPWRPLLLGVTAKYLYAAEPDVTAEVTDTETIKSFSSPDFLQNLRSHNKGVGVDLGALLFFQGSAVDYSLAAKVDDAGNTKLAGGTDAPTEFKQVSSVGLGLTLHTGSDSIHFAADYRDIGNAYDEELFKRLYIGTKVMLRTYVGLAAGYYNGYPSLGAEVDLLLLRIAATSYTRELGDHPGVNPRHIYMVSVSTGF